MLRRRTGMMAILAVAIGGAVGAVLRYWVYRLTGYYLGTQFPFGTLAVNLSGALALGVLVGAAVSDDALRLAGTGLLGAYTTFSTWALEAHRQAEDGRGHGALLNLGVSLVLGLTAAWAGHRLGGAL